MLLGQKNTGPLGVNTTLVSDREPIQNKFNIDIIGICYLVDGCTCIKTGKQGSFA